MLTTILQLYSPNLIVHAIIRVYSATIPQTNLFDHSNDDQLINIEHFVYGILHLEVCNVVILLILVFYGDSLWHSSCMILSYAKYEGWLGFALHVELLESSLGVS